MFYEPNTLCTHLRNARRGGSLTLTVCMEQVHKPHNVSAIIRTADAVGVHEVHAVWHGSRMRTMASAAAGSNSWVQVKTHRTIGDAVAHLKGRHADSGNPSF